MTPFKFIDALFAHNKKDVICIPFKDSKGDYFSIDQEIEIMKLIAELLEDPKKSDIDELNDMIHDGINLRIEWR